MNPSYRHHRKKMIANAVYKATQKACDTMAFLCSKGDLLPVETETTILIDCHQELQDCVDTLQRFLPRSMTTAPTDWNFKKDSYKAKPLLKRQCRGTRTDGEPCRINAIPGSLFCRHHKGQTQSLKTLEGILEQMRDDG